MITHLRHTPNDPDFDYEIPGFIAVYSDSPNSIRTARECLFGMNAYDLLPLDVLNTILLEVHDEEAKRAIREVIDIRRFCQNANSVA